MHTDHRAAFEVVKQLAYERRGIGFKFPEAKAAMEAVGLNVSTRALQRAVQLGIIRRLGRGHGYGV
jgi:hypothetical protein